MQTLTRQRSNAVVSRLNRSFASWHPPQPDNSRTAWPTWFTCRTGLQGEAGQAPSQSGPRGGAGSPAASLAAPNRRRLRRRRPRAGTPPPAARGRSAGTCHMNTSFFLTLPKQSWEACITDVTECWVDTCRRGEAPQRGFVTMKTKLGQALPAELVAPVMPPMLPRIMPAQARGCYRRQTAQTACHKQQLARNFR